ncbi:MAG: ABC transporter permease [Acidobacteria bacterium]|nr:ABC transporter permease [Acidobacteriota bacterium]MBI3424184.1 ABC transporter permease [Acidobacteriota bacterium]
MNNLVASNLTHHPGRTFASVVGVSVGVVLVVLTVGLVRGTLREVGRRGANTGVELWLRGAGQGLSLTSADMNIPLAEVEKVRAVLGVAYAMPVGQSLEMGGSTGLGIRTLEGINFDEFAAATQLHIIAGQSLPARGNVAVIDFKEAESKKLKVGDKITALQGRELTIVGIYEPEMGARVKVPLATMQEALTTGDKCSMIYIKCANPAEQEAVAQRLDALFPDYRVIFTRELPQLFATGFSGFNVFLNVVAGLATVISLLVILLTMYSTVTERTRQIGILKALGMSKTDIAAVFETEALLISALGVLLGLAIALTARYFLVNQLNWKIELETGYIIYACLGGLLSGALGALYPALRAARQDPVDALSYE